MTNRPDLYTTLGQECGCCARRSSDCASLCASTSAAISAWAVVNRAE